MSKRLIIIGGGEIKTKSTISIDTYFAGYAKKHALPERANVVFVGTASHDSMPYFNSFRKTYTSLLDIKAEVALTVYGEMTKEKLSEKIKSADGIYIGGGDTYFMLETWRQTGLGDMIIEAYENGVPVVGLSAGGVCWFDVMYTDYKMKRGISDGYVLVKGLSFIKDAICPHYKERRVDFDRAFAQSQLTTAFALENDCALEFLDGNFTKTISSGGKAYYLTKVDGSIKRREL